MAIEAFRRYPLLSFGVASILLSAFPIILFSPISDPQPLILPLPSAWSTSVTQSNTDLQRATPVADGFLKDPEDVCMDKEGTLYTATRDGWIKRLHRGDSSWEDWKMLDSQTLLGITVTEDGGIIVCDSEEGLLKVNEDGASVLLSHVNGSKLSFADDVIEAPDGSLYFSVATTKFGLHDWYMDVLEAKPHGQLLRFDPSTNETSIVIDHLGFANGVALSKDQDFLIVCETWKFRCLRHWLKGENEGKTEIFTENLPGGPDNINLAPDGTFWISLIQIVREGWEFVHSSKAAKHFIATFPESVKVASALRRKAVVVNVGQDGKILRKLEDPTGKVLSFVTSALEFDGHLYLGSLNSNYVAKLPLANIV